MSTTADREVTPRSSIAQHVMESAAMRDALATPIPGGEWPEDTKYRAAAQPKAIAGVLVEHIHKHLVNAEIGFLYREKITGRGDSVVLGKASAVSGKLHHYSKLDLLVEINWEAWGKLTPDQRVALMDHELEHFKRDDEKGTYYLVDHDVEEFSSIVRRWGLWLPDLKRFEAAMAQLNLGLD